MFGRRQKECIYCFPACLIFLLPIKKMKCCCHQVNVMCNSLTNCVFFVLLLSILPTNGENYTCSSPHRFMCDLANGITCWNKCYAQLDGARCVRVSVCDQIRANRRISSMAVIMIYPTWKRIMDFSDGGTSDEQLGRIITCNDSNI